MKKKQFSSIVKASRKDNKGQEIWTEIWESALPLGNLACFLTVQLPEKMGPGLCLSWALLIASSYWQETGERYVAAICMMQPSDEWNINSSLSPNSAPGVGETTGRTRFPRWHCPQAAAGSGSIPAATVIWKMRTALQVPEVTILIRECGGSSHLPTWDGHVRILKSHFLLGIGWKK